MAKRLWQIFCANRRAVHRHFPKKKNSECEPMQKGSLLHFAGFMGLTMGKRKGTFEMVSKNKKSPGLLILWGIFS